MKKTNAKFYCEHCASEVPANARICTTCGRFFAAVRCPHCGKTGDAAQFRNGCPACGYAVSSSELGELPQKATKKRRLRFKEKKKLKAAFSSHRVPTAGDATLPLWIYGVTFVTLGCVIGALVMLLKRS